MTIPHFPVNASKTVTALGFDYGTKRIGVAFGQSLTGTARSLATVSARDGIPNWQQLEKLIDTWRPDYLIIGLPFNIDGTESDMLIRAEKFARRLQGRFHLPCFGIDERLSSVEAEGLQADEPAASIDSIAARLILENWFTQWRHQQQHGKNPDQ